MKKSGVNFNDSISLDKLSSASATRSLDVSGKSISEARMPMTIKESKIAQELTKKEDNERDFFDKNHHLYVKNRNTILGEDTPRKGDTNVELLVPFKHTVKLNMNTLKMEQDKTGNFTRSGTTRMPGNSGKLMKRDIDIKDFHKLTSVQSAKSMVDHELQGLKKVLAHHHNSLRTSDTSKVSATAVLTTGGLSAPVKREQDRLSFQTTGHLTCEGINRR